MITKNIPMLILAVYLIAVGIISVTGVTLGPLPGLLAIIAGVLLLVGK